MTRSMGACLSSPEIHRWRRRQLTVQWRSLQRTRRDSASGQGRRRRKLPDLQWLPHGVADGGEDSSNSNDIDSNNKRSKINRATTITAKKRTKLMVRRCWFDREEKKKNWWWWWWWSMIWRQGKRTQKHTGEEEKLRNEKKEKNEMISPNYKLIT